MINSFKAPTPVQAQSLVHLQSRIDLVIAAKTGQGKTLCFGLPILDLLIKKIDKAQERMEGESSEEGASEEGEDEQEEGKPKRKKKFQFDSVKALILSPTRELAI